jgi:CheY-like chemotaxis protein
LSNDLQTLPDPFAQLRHDMRTPVNHIIGFSEMLIEDADAKDRSTLIPDLQKIHTAAHHLLDLINAKPVAPSPTTGSPQPSNPEVADPLFPMTGRILAVDDNPENLELLVRRLEQHGLDVTKTTNSLETLDILRSGAFDLVLLDVMMPGLDGFATCRELKARPQLADAPVIFITACNYAEQVVAGFQAGAADYIAKPIRVEEVLARVRTQLALRRCRQQERAEQLQLQTLVEGMREGLLLLDPQGCIRYSNPALRYGTAPSRTNLKSQTQTSSTPTPNPKHQTPNP